jgi:hypothetical protein
VRDVSHDQRAVERDASLRKDALVGKVGRVDTLETRRADARPEKAGRRRDDSRATPYPGEGYRRPRAAHRHRSTRPPCDAPRFRSRTRASGGNASAGCPRRRQLTLNDVSIGAEIHQQPSSDHAVDFWELHTRGRLTSGLTLVSSNRIKPLARRAVQAAVGLPDVVGPAANELRILFFSGRIANICNRHRASMRKILRPCDIDAPVQPARDLPVQLRVATGFDSAAQPREVRDERFHRPAVFLGVLRRVGVDDEVLNRRAAGTAPGSRGEFIEYVLARLPPGDASPAQGTSFHDRDVTVNVGLGVRGAEARETTVHRSNEENEGRTEGVRPARIAGGDRHESTEMQTRKNLTCGLHFCRFVPIAAGRRCRPAGRTPCNRPRLRSCSVDSVAPVSHFLRDLRSRFPDSGAVSSPRPFDPIDA